MNVLRTLIFVLVASPALSAQGGTLSHSADSMTVIDLNSVSCNAGGFHTDNSYWRSYGLSSLGVTSSILVTSIDYAIEEAAGGALGAVQPATIRLYLDPTPPNPSPMSELILLHTESLMVMDVPLSSGLAVNAPLSAPVLVPCGATLVVEFFTPDGQATSTSFFYGSNNLGETGPTYLSAADCGVPEPTPVAALGFSNMQIILDVNYLPGNSLIVPGGTLTGSVPIGVDNPSVTNSTLQFSTDAGVSWALCTMSGSSPNPNPLMMAPMGISNFTWNTGADMLGASGPQMVLLRVTSDDGMFAFVCTQPVVVDNPVSCTITAPIGTPVCGDVTIVFDTTDGPGAGLVASFEFSTDAGISFSPATDAGGGSLTGNPTGVFMATTGSTWVWDTIADGIGQSAGAIMRISVSGIATCTTIIEIDNMPQCMITAPVMSAVVGGGDIDITFDGSDLCVNPLTSTFEWSTDGGVIFNPATAAGSSAVANPDPSRSSPFAGVVFTWDSAADGVGAMSAGQSVQLCINVGNGSFTSRCCVDMVMVDNTPTCMMTAPSPGAMVTRDVTITFDGADPSDDPLDTDFEYSVDGGLTWLACTAETASPTANPDVGRATPFAGVTFVWDSLLDSVARMSVTPTMVRAVVTDPGGGMSNCGVVVMVDNTFVCETNCGDCDDDASLPNVMDSLEAAQIAVALITPTTTQTGCCDTNSSGTIDIIDALLISQSAAGLPVTLSCP